jgi:hypothetical protein
VGSGGYDALRGYDSSATGGNGDGKISAADQIWSALRVWQDLSQDGITDAGELKSLSELGITELSLTSTALGATTAEGAQLLSYGAVTFGSGRTSNMFEAILNANDSVTQYAGEAGLASSLRREVAANDDAWPYRPFHFGAVRRAANDEEGLILSAIEGRPCIVGNRRVW